MEILNLGQQWELGEPLDADTGGFGRVFHARSATGEEVVAKLVRKEPGAEREMLFDGEGKPNVVPILDSGEHGGLCRHLVADDRIVPLWEAFRDVLVGAAPRLAA